MQINSGKVFEKEFKDSCQYYDIWCWRIADSYVNAKKIDNNAYVPCQPADFLVKYDNLICFFELKHTDKNYITVEHDDVRGMIRKTQIDQMLRLASTDVLCMFVLQYGEDTYAISVQNLVKCLEETGKHSINPLDVVQHSGLIVSNCVLRKYRRYDIKQILTRISPCDKIETS